MSHAGVWLKCIQFHCVRPFRNKESTTAHIMDLTKFECSSFPMSYDDVVRLLLKVPPKPVPVRGEKQTGSVLRVLRV